MPIFSMPYSAACLTDQNWTGSSPSLNYAQGAFKNQLETPFLTNGATQLSIRIENWLADKKNNPA